MCEYVYACKNSLSLMAYGFHPFDLFVMFSLSLQQVGNKWGGVPVGNKISKSLDAPSMFFSLLIGLAPFYRYVRLAIAWKAVMLATTPPTHIT